MKKNNVTINSLNKFEITGNAISDAVFTNNFFQYNGRKLESFTWDLISEAQFNNADDFHNAMYEKFVKRVNEEKSVAAIDDEFLAKHKTMIPMHIAFERLLNGKVAPGSTSTKNINAFDIIKAVMRTRLNDGSEVFFVFTKRKGSYFINKLNIASAYRDIVNVKIDMSGGEYKPTVYSENTIGDTTIKTPEELIALLGASEEEEKVTKKKAVLKSPIQLEKPSIKREEVKEEIKEEETKETKVIKALLKELKEVVKKEDADLFYDILANYKDEVELDNFKIYARSQSVIDESGDSSYDKAKFFAIYFAVRSTEAVKSELLSIINDAKSVFASEYGSDDIELLDDVIDFING